MRREDHIYATERMRTPVGRRLLVEYLDDPRPSAGRPPGPGVITFGTMVHELLAVVSENDATLFTVAQTVSGPPLRSGSNPREKGQDAALRQEGVRRLRIGEWQVDADDMLPPLA